MSERFFIEFRPWRKTHIREFAERANRRLIKLGSEKIEVNHMTLYGPSEVKDLEKVARKVEDVAKAFELVTVKTFRFDCFDNPDKKWVVIRVKPNQKLERLRYELYQALYKIAPPQPWDKESSYKFHISIGKTTRDNTFNRLRRTVNQWTAPEIEQFFYEYALLMVKAKYIRNMI